MSKPLTLDSDPDLYFLMEAAELIGVQVGQDHAQRERFAKEMREAVRKGELGAYYFKDGKPLRMNAIGELVRMDGNHKHCTVEPTTPLCVRPAGVNTWLKTTNWGFTWNVQAPASTASTVEQRQNEKQQPPDWVTKAQEMALQIIKRQKAIDLYPSQLYIADEIARKFRVDGIFGPSGKPLSGESIKRWALKGISSEEGKQRSTTIARGKRGNF
jgi:hypothetical protein